MAPKFAVEYGVHRLYYWLHNRSIDLIHSNWPLLYDIGRTGELIYSSTREEYKENNGLQRQ